MDSREVVVPTVEPIFRGDREQSWGQFSCEIEEETSQAERVQKNVDLKRECWVGRKMKKGALRRGARVGVQA